jgi:AcrR family transcriptional regulator
MTTDGMPVRWGEGRRADSEFAREQILDAALRCYQKNTFQKTRMEHIAREAKVSRTTIYRYFESRDEVLVGVVLRALHELLDFIGVRVAGVESFAEFIVETIAITVDQVPHSPLFNMLMSESDVVMDRIRVCNDQIFAATSEHIKPRFDAAFAKGELRKGVEFQQLLDWIIHMGSTFVLVPSAQCDAAGIRQMLWRYLAPSIVRDEAIPADKLG